MNDTIQAIVEQFWTGLGIILESSDIAILEDDINITIQTPDSALVIGMHGKSIDLFAHILSRIIEKATGSYVHVHLEVNDYMKAKDERLFRLLDSKISQALTTGKQVQIQNLNSYDRKKAHNYIAEKAISDLSTHSEGSGVERILVIEYSGIVQSQEGLPSQTKGVDGASVVLLSEDGIGI